MVWDKEKDLDRAVWVDQVNLFLQPFSFTIELLVLQAKYCSPQYCSCLTHFGLIFPYMPLDLNWLNFSRIETKTFYNASVLKSIDWENKPMYLRFGILKSIFSTQNWYFAFFNSKIKGPAGGGGGGAKNLMKIFP